MIKKTKMNGPDLVIKLRGLRDVLSSGLVERDLAVRLALLSSLAGEHLLMVGPPGTAKSLVVRRLHLAFADSTYFERLLTRFTVPEELFGPLSIKGLEEDRYERLTDAYLPKASIAFLDEIFKANSAILNTLLTLLNEREFDNGTVRDKTPLVAVIGASNELPEGEELGALLDRFLLRLHVGPVTKDAFPALLNLRGESTPLVSDALKLRRAELEQVRITAEAVEVPEDVVALLCELRDQCTAEEIQVSDRRWRKVVKLLQVSAATNGRSRVSIWDCWLLQHCLWDTPEAREKIYDWYTARVGASGGMSTARLTDIVTMWEATLKRDQGSRSQQRNGKKGLLVFKNAKGEHTLETRGRAQAKRGLNGLFLAPAGARNDRGTIDDRTNGGKGYIRAELDELRTSEDFGWKSFSHSAMRDAYLVDSSNWLMEDVDLAPVLEPTRHKGLYIDGCTSELDELRSEVEAYQNKLLVHMETLETEIHEHLWVSRDFAGPAAENLKRTRREVEVLLSRVTMLRGGFQRLPREGKPLPETAGQR